MRFRICHVTRYGYADPVSLCHSIAHLKPRDCAHQKCLSSQVRVDPWPAVSRDYLDFFGNRVTYFAIQQSHAALEVTAQSEVEVLPQSLPPGGGHRGLGTGPGAAATPARRGGHGQDLHPGLAHDPHQRPGHRLCPCLLPPGRPVLAALTDLMGRIYRDFEYDPHFSTVATPLSEVLEHRRGVCQDFAHLGLACLRGLGFAARYVSGYLETLPPPGQVKLQGSDASHAWFAVFIPDLGWVDFDPTNDQIPGEQHITTAIGRDYQDVTPLQGVFYGGGAHDLRIAVECEPH